MSTLILKLVFASVLAAHPAPEYDPMADLRARVEKCWANGDGSTAVWSGWNGAENAKFHGLQPFDECTFYHGRLVAAACNEGPACRKLKAFLFGVKL